MGHFAGRAAAWLGVGWDHIIEHATVDAARVGIATTTAGWISKRKERPRTIPLAAGLFSVPVVLGVVHAGAKRVSGGGWTAINTCA
jgi:hypothetical protein